LVLVGGDDDSEIYPFFDRLEIGRYHPGREAAGLLLVSDPTVSSRHCILTQDPDGRCFVRDASRNGTRLDGRRLSPNLRTEIRVGQELSIGRQLTFRLEGEAPVVQKFESDLPAGTVAQSHMTTLTVLVGDIRDYTVLVQQATSAALQNSVGRVFERLEKEVVALGGTLKEFQGDALFAFWEQGSTENHAVGACRAALELDRLAAELANDNSVWQVEDLPLRMDWALATGPVVISGYGTGNALGLSMVGEPVVLAFRIEKFANDETGSIVACTDTMEMATTVFEFRDLGTREVKGFDDPRRLYSLVGLREKPPGH
jgi:class 3 adenylate cyclase